MPGLDASTVSRLGLADLILALSERGFEVRLTTEPRDLTVARIIQRTADPYGAFHEGEDPDPTLALRFACREVFGF